MIPLDLEIISCEKKSPTKLYTARSEGLETSFALRRKAYERHRQTQTSAIWILELAKQFAIPGREVGVW